jgi:tRNA (guanine37-N1)-methyltransferase
MLHVAVVTLFPEMLSAVEDYGVTGRAVRNGLVRISTFNPRDFAEGPHRSVDDRPYGGGPGMVMTVQPLRDAIHAARNTLPGAKVIYLSPQGGRLTQKAVAGIAAGREVILVAGRYEGLDERLIAREIDEEWSIGDYVLSGGELPAMVLIDAMARTVPGVLGHADSAYEDSFVNGLLDYPHYTRPETIDGDDVPEVLLSGDHRQIWRWRMKQALGRTWQRRPDLIAVMELDEEQQELLREYQSEIKD